MLKWFFLTVPLLMSPVGALPQGNEANADAEIRETLAGFVRAFDGLDWNSFRGFFADDATVFYPRAFPERANGHSGGDIEGSDPEAEEE